MPDIRYLRAMISDVSVVAAYAGIDITTAGRLRAVLVEGTGVGHPAVELDMTRTWSCDAFSLHTLQPAHKRRFPKAASCGWSSLWTVPSPALSTSPA